MQYEALKCWGFAWATGRPRPYVTSIVGHSRQNCHAEAEKILGMPWKKIYCLGGRAIKCTLTPNAGNERPPVGGPID